MTSHEYNKHNRKHQAHRDNLHDKHQNTEVWGNPQARSGGIARNDGDDGHGATHPGATNAARSQPRVTISMPTGKSALPSPMLLKPQRPPCFDPSQRGGPTVQAWLFTINVFFDANYVSEDTAKIRYTVSLLRGPAMDWWRVIVTKSTDYATLATREGQTGPWASSYFMEVPQYCTWDAWCAGLHARFEPIAASIATKVQNGIAERHIGMVMDVARTSMIHAAAPHFLWPFAVQYAAHHINLQPRVSLPETTPSLRWTGKVGNASVFRVWGSRAFVRDTSVDKLSSHAVPCVFLGFPPDVTFDGSVSYYRLFPYRTASLPPLPLFLAPSPPLVDPLPPQGLAP
ncbi:unnamed protein product [Closterium sp. NIES-53]